jgi:pantoate--beta-alanine ligase
VDLIHSVEAMQAHADAARAAGRRLVLVPTMGALHAGHAALVEHARTLGDHRTVSVFVNPTQFAPGEDYGAYPRTLDADLDALRALGGVDAVFAPSVEAMYPFGLPPYATTQVRDLGRHLCGAHRPGHFDGVTSVVARLFLACRPHVAVFGQKDAQQLAILRRMTAEMGFGIDIAGHPIVRDLDGLALSSRNAYLSAAERAQAPALARGLFAASHRAGQGERRAAALADLVRAEIDRAPLARVQYAELVDADTLQPVETLVEDGPSQGRYLLAVAAFLGTTRLIDNVQIDLRAQPARP